MNYNASWLQFEDGTDKSWDGANGTCSKSGYSPRSVCQGQASCSISGYTTQSTCTAAGTCSASQYTTQSSCTLERRVLQPRSNNAERLHVDHGLLQLVRKQTETVREKGRHVGLWYLGTGHLDRWGLEPRDLDAEKPQHLERLRDRSRPRGGPRHCGRQRPDSGRAERAATPVRCSTPSSIRPARPQMKGLS